MPNKIDYLGHKYGKLAVIGEGELRGRHNRYVLCKCECGNEKLIFIGSLRKGATTSCGCIEKERREVGFGKMFTVHGLANTPINNTYHNMKQRCYDKGNTSYKDYGGRGIKCEWNSFVEFYKDMGGTYKEGLTIERINNDGNYSKENCRRATRLEQNNNKRSNTIREYDGIKLTIAQWSRKLGIKQSTLGMRFNKYNRPIERVLATN